MENFENGAENYFACDFRYLTILIDITFFQNVKQIGIKQKIVIVYNY